MAGRPTKYAEDYPEKLLEMMEKGYLDCQIYAAFDVSKDTFYEWLKAHPEFKEAHQRGLPKCEAMWATKMQTMIDDREDKGFKPLIAVMNNKFGWGKNESSSGNTTNIHINQMAVLNTKDDYCKLLDEVKTQAAELNLIDLVPEQVQLISDQGEERG